MDDLFEKAVVIIDGSFIIHRVYHATRPNIDTGFRVANNRFKTIANSHPDCDINIVFDKGGCEYRKGLNPYYKANRPLLPDVFYTFQKSIIDQQLEGNSTVYISKGIEGDDLIASVKKLKGVNCNVYIYTRDKDIFQLIDDHCFIIDPFEYQVFDKEKCKEKHGVYPEKIWFKLCLMGDKADGIAGIPSVGNSTAISLANKYDTLEDLLEGEKWIEPYRNMLYLNKQLVCLRDDVI